MINLQAVCEIANTGAALICVCDDDNLMAPVHELGRQLVDVTLDTARLREEEVANHGDIVCWRHLVRGSVVVAQSLFLCRVLLRGQRRRFVEIQMRRRNAFAI